MTCNIEKESREICALDEVLYWRDEYMSPLARGSKTRVKPDPRMKGDNRYIHKTKINGDYRDVLFDELYIDYWTSVTGINPFASNALPDSSTESPSIMLLVDCFLESVKITPSSKNPRHSLFIKFLEYLETHNDRT